MELAEENRLKKLRGGFSRELVEKALIYRSLDEGVANYLAIQVGKEVVGGDVKPNDVYACQMEWSFANGEPYTGQDVSLSTPLNNYIAGILATLGGAAIEAFAKPIDDSMTIRDIVRNSREAWFCFEQTANVIGYFWVRANVEASNGSIGSSIDRLILGPPSSLLEIQENVLSLMPR